MIRSGTFLLCVVAFLVACNKDDDKKLHNFDIVSAGCVLDIGPTVCPDSNRFSVVIRGTAYGPVGTILTVSVANTSVDLDCGNWDLIPESDFFKYCQRASGQSENTNFDYTGQLDCIPLNAFYGSLSYTVNTTDSGVAFGGGFFGDDTGTVFCGL